jgi:hypothetical protein
MESIMWEARLRKYRIQMHFDGNGSHGLKYTNQEKDTGDKG